MEKNRKSFDYSQRTNDKNSRSFDYLEAAADFLRNPNGLQGRAVSLALSAGFESSPPLRFTGEDQAVVSKLAGEAHNDPVAWDACILIVSDLMEAGKPLPKPLQKFHQNILQGREKPKGKRGPNPVKNELRDRIIRGAVAMEMRNGHPAYANGSDTCITACEIVSVHLNTLGIPLKSKSVQEIWKKEEDKESLVSGTKEYSAFLRGERAGER